MKCLMAMFSALALLMFVSAANANTIASSTMYFQGTLTCSGGVCSGIVPMLDEVAAGIGDGVGGYDVYADNGANAQFGNDPGSGPLWTSQLIASNDAWPSWTPDTPDWYQYSLEFYTDGGVQKWRLQNHPGATAAIPWSVGGNAAAGVPMSGTMNWTTLYAAETDVGAYLSGTGTAEIPGGAAGQGGGAQAWDMDWSWGSEMVPLELPGFSVALTQVSGTTYDVVLTPIPEPTTALLLVAGLTGLAVAGRRRS